jgi:cytoskeletal protein CcmA (bactofilin family)
MTLVSVLLMAAAGFGDADMSPWDIMQHGTTGAVVRFDSSATVSGDLKAAGALVEVKAPAKGSVTIFGAQVISTAEVEGNLTTFAAVVQSSGEVKGKTKVGGAVVYLDGSYTDTVEAGAAVVFIRGHVKGPIMVQGAEVTIDSGAVIDDTLRYSCEHLNISQGAVLHAGKREFTAQEKGEQEHHHRFQRRHHRHPVAGWILKTVLGFLFMFGSGLFLSLAFPTYFKKVTARLTAKPGWSALVGGIAFVSAFIFPIVCIILGLVVIGIGTAAFFGGLYLIGFLFAGTFAATAMGRWLLSLGKRAKEKKEPNIIVAALVGTAITAVLCAIPYAGWLFCLAALVFGFGAFLAHLWLARKAAEETKE